MDVSPAGMSLALLGTLGKLSTSSRGSGTSSCGLASPGNSGISTTQSEQEWPADSCDELEDLDESFDVRTEEGQSTIRGSPMLSFSPAPGLQSSPSLSAMGASPAPGLVASPAIAAWPNTPEFTPLTRTMLRRTPLLGPLNLGHSAITASPEQAWPSTPELTPLCGPLDLGPMALPSVPELPAAADSDESDEDALPALAPNRAAANSALPQGLPLWTMEQYAAQQAAILAYFSAGYQYQPFVLPLAVSMPAPAAAKQRAAAPQILRKSYDAKPLILAKPSRDFQEPAPGVPRTTLLFRNMPNNQTRKMLMDILDREGFERQYDFLYLPMDFQSRISMGYAFVNFTMENTASRAKAVFEGYTKWRIPSRKVCGVSWSHPHQGFEAHVERYRNSPVMHEDVPDHYKPVILREGQRVHFPAASQKLKAPRQRNSKAAK